MNHRQRSIALGFTLIEVLVALAIIAFGLIAVFGQLSQSATAAGRLREKTLAYWVASNALSELRLRGEFPAVGTRSDDVEMANSRWRYEIEVSETDSDILRRAEVTVAYEADPERPLATLVGFLGKPVQAAGSSAARPGWPLLSADGQAVRQPGDNDNPAPAPPGSQAPP